MHTQFKGWNTWDPRGVNRFIEPQLDLEIIFATLDTNADLVLDEYSAHTFEERLAIAQGKSRLPEEYLGNREQGQAHKKQAVSGLPDWPMGRVRCFGPRTMDLSRAYIHLQHDREYGYWSMIAKAENDQLAVDVKIEQQNPALRMVLIVRGAWGICKQHSYDTASNIITAESGDQKVSICLDSRPISVCHGQNHDEVIKKIPHSDTFKPAKAPAVAVIMPFSSFSLRTGKAETDFVPLSYQSNPPGKDPQLTEAEAAIEAISGWSLCWDAFYKRPQLPVNKEWVRAGFMGMKLHGFDYSAREIEYAVGPAMFSWDSAFGAMMISKIDKQYAKEIAKNTVFYNRKPDGGFSTCRMGRHQLNFLTNPPVITWAVSRIYELTGDREFINTVYHDLKSWFFWMKRERDRNQDGLYEWGVNPEQFPFWQREMGARLESGLDNSPMYYDIPFSETYNTFEMNCIDLCSFQALCAEHLAKMAQSLAIQEDIETFTREYEILKDNINSRLWDEDRGIYANRFWNGKFADALTPTSFYPLLAGIANQDQVQKMIKNWITNPEHFGNKFGIPSVDASDPCYSPDGNYWRGRIWPPMNYLVYHGVKRYDPQSASGLAQKCLNTFLTEWKEHGHIHENYSALTGYGEPTVEKGVCSCCFYHWGGLMALMALEDQD